MRYMAFKALILTILLQSACMAASFSVSSGEGGSATIAVSFDLDSSTEMEQSIDMTRGGLVEGLQIDGEGHNVVSRTLSASGSTISGSLSAEGGLASQACSYAHDREMALSQQAEARGQAQMEVAGSLNARAASQGVGVDSGLLSSVQSVAVDGEKVIACQDSAALGALAYAEAKASSGESSVDLVGGLNGVGLIRENAIAVAGDELAATADFRAISLLSKGYAASRATSSEGESYTYADSKESLASKLQARAGSVLLAEQSLKGEGDLVLYARSPGQGGAVSYSGDEVAGTLSASGDGTPKGELLGDVEETMLGAEPVPGYWVGYGGNLVDARPFLIEDSSGVDHVFVRQYSSNALFDNRGGTWYNMGGAFYGDPWAIRDSSGNIHVFVRGSDSGLWDLFLDPTSMGHAWNGLGGYIYSSPTAVIDPTSPGYAGIMVHGSDDGLWLADLNLNTLNAVWHPLGGRYAGTPYVVAQGSKYYTFVWGSGSDYSVWVNECTTIGGSGTWYPLGGYTYGSPVAISEPGWSDYIAVFTKGSDGALWVYDYNMVTHSGAWLPRGGLINGQPFVIADGDTTGDYIHAFIRGSDDSLWDCRSSSGLGSYTWYSLGGKLLSNPGAMWDDSPENQIDVAGIGYDSSLWRYWT